MPTGAPSSATVSTASAPSCAARTSIRRFAEPSRGRFRRHDRAREPVAERRGRPRHRRQGRVDRDVHGDREGPLRLSPLTEEFGDDRLDHHRLRRLVGIVGQAAQGAGGVRRPARAALDQVHQFQHLGRQRLLGQQLGQRADAGDGRGEVVQTAGEGVVRMACSVSSPGSVGVRGDACHEQRKRLGQRPRLLLDAAHRLRRHDAFRVEHQVHTANRDVAIHQARWMRRAAPVPASATPPATSCRASGRWTARRWRLSCSARAPSSGVAHTAQRGECAQCGGGSAACRCFDRARRCSRPRNAGSSRRWMVAVAKLVHRHRCRGVEQHRRGEVRLGHRGRRRPRWRRVTRCHAGAGRGWRACPSSCTNVPSATVKRTPRSTDHRDHADRMLAIHQQWRRDGAHRHACHDGVIPPHDRCSGRRRRRRCPASARAAKARSRGTRARPTRRGSRRNVATATRASESSIVSPTHAPAPCSVSTATVSSRAKAACVVGNASISLASARRRFERALSSGVPPPRDAPPAGASTIGGCGLDCGRDAAGASMPGIGCSGIDTPRHHSANSTFTVCGMIPASVPRCRNSCTAARPASP